MAQTRIVIIGAGRLGRAFAHVFGRGHQSTVGLWDAQPGITPGVTLLSAGVPNADLVLFAVPTDAIRKALADVQPLATPQSTFVFFSKGLEEHTLQCAAEIAAETLGTRQPWVVIGGPMVAEDIRSGARGHGVIAGPGRQIRRTLESIVPPEAMSFMESAHPVDVSLAGVLKNVYALVYGLGVGLGWSPIALSDLWKRCENEMVVAADRCGIEREVIIGPAGIDDFHGTGGSPHSRNRNAGVQLAQGTIDQSAESVRSFALLIQRFPSLSALECIHALQEIFHQAPAARTFSSLTHSIHS